MRTLLLLAILAFRFPAQAQQIKTMTIEQSDNPESTSGGIPLQVGCKDVGDASIIFYSTIKGLVFTSNKSINEQKYISEKNKYILCVDPETHFLTIIHPDFIPKKITISKLTPAEVVYYIINSNDDEKTTVDGDSLQKGEYHLTSIPEGATIKIEGNPEFRQTTPYTFKGWEARVYKLSIEKENYKISKIEIQISSGKAGSKNVRLDPKQGTLSLIAANSAASGAIVFLDGEQIGALPLLKKRLNQRKYFLTIEKKGFSTIKKEVQIKDSQDTTLQIELYPTKTIAITANVSKCQVFLDKVLIGKTPINHEVSIGSHIISVSKDNFVSDSKTVEITENSTDPTTLHFNLDDYVYNVKLISKSVASVYMDERFVGNTPGNTTAKKGRHKFKFQYREYIPKTIHKTVKPGHVNVVKNNSLFPKGSFNANFLYGLNSSWGLEAGGTAGRVSFLVAWLVEVKNDIHTNKVSVAYPGESFQYDSYNMRKTQLKQSVTDSAGSGYSIKLGYILLKPFPLRLHIGYGLQNSFQYNTAYEATRNFRYQPDYSSYNNGTYSNIVSSYGSDSVRAGQIVMGAEVEKEHFNYFLGGVSIPISRFNFQADYWHNPSRGGTVILGIGLILSKSRS